LKQGRLPPSRSRTSCTPCFFQRSSSLGVFFSCWVSALLETVANHLSVCLTTSSYAVTPPTTPPIHSHLVVYGLPEEFSHEEVCFCNFSPRCGFQFVSLRFSSTTFMKWLYLPSSPVSLSVNFYSGEGICTLSLCTSDDPSGVLASPAPAPFPVVFSPPWGPSGPVQPSSDLFPSIFPPQSPACYFDVPSLSSLF